MTDSAQTKHIAAGAIEWKDAAKGSFVAVFSTFGVKDLDGDITLPGSMPVGKSVPISAFNHSSWDGALPVGYGVIRADGKKAWIEGQFLLDTQAGREHYEVVKATPSMEWSYGYKVLETDEVTDEMYQNGVYRVLKRLDPFEVSPVLVGAGGLGRTYTVSVKSADLSPTTIAALAEIDKLTAEIKALNRKQRALLIEEEPRLFEVDHATRIAAERGVKLATAILSQATQKQAPRIRWLTPDAAREMKVFGFVYPQFTEEVWLKDTMAPDLAFTVASHETLHAFRVAGITSADVGRHEEEAARFGEALAKLDATGLPIRTGRRESSRTTKSRPEILVDPDLRVYLSRLVPEGKEIAGAWSVPDSEWQRPVLVPGQYLSPYFDQKSMEPPLVEMYWDEMFILA